MKLKDCKVVFICPDHNEKYHTRKVHMETLLKKIGFTDIVHHKSGSEQYPTCLAIAMRDILQKYKDEPLLLLEDDVEFINNMSFDIPLGADAIYLGLSKSAGHPTENYNIYYAKFEPYSDTQVRVINMLSGHAVLYLSNRYKQQVIDIFLQSSLLKQHADIHISRIQKNFNIYANKIPTFYQSNKFNKVQDNGLDLEKSTKIQIMDDLSLALI